MKTLSKLFPVLLIIFFASAEAAAQSNAIGLRFGDPSGLTFKHYTGGNAWEVSLGRTHWFYRDNWYYNRFDRWYNNQGFGYKEVQVTSYRSGFPTALQVHYLWQHNLNSVGDANTNGLDWYVGVGAQARFHSFYYRYRYKVDGDPNWYYADGGREVNLDLGADGVIGLEYTLPKAPISFFIDATVFMEVIDDPFLFHWQGGIGGRFRF